MYIFYPDLYWIMQWLVMVFGLLCVKTILNLKFTVKRIAVISAIFATVETLGIILLPGVVVYKLIVHSTVLPVCVAWCFKVRTVNCFIKEWLLCYMTTWLLNGCVQWIYNETGQNGILPLALCAVFLYFLVWMGRKILKLKDSYFKVEVTYGSLRLQTKGLYDSGNLLRDPFDKEPISLGSRGFLQPIIDCYNKPMRQIPFSTVSGDGQLSLLVVDSISVYANEKKYVTFQAKIGVVERNEFGRASCKFLLHHEHMTTRGEE